ncbi:MAG: methyl-accepting chemotaxis protein, partial [Betaproteobacteria bacterium]|nr:methyl-accepting chemotaxis protein [Betaproteobacteria bacterium]
TMRIHSLQFKVLALVAGAMLLSLVIAVVSLYRVNASVHDLERVTQVDLDTQQNILRAAVAFKTQVQEWKNVLLRGKDPAALDKHWKGFEEAESVTRALVAEARAGVAQPEIRKALEQVGAAHKEAGERYRKGLQAYKDAGFDATAADKLVAGIDRAPTLILQEAEKSAVDSGARLVNDTVDEAQTIYRLAILFTGLAMLATLVVLWYFVRGAVLKPVTRAVEFAERIAGGDLSGDLRSEARDEVGQLLRALANMKENLAEVVMQVRVSAESVATASNQVAVGTTDLSQRTEEQASSLEETAASMEELSSTVKQNAENAHQADELSRGASKRAEQGGAEVVQMVVTMNEISTSASRIAEIISVIDAIAFQTNILALNAAVEAARAGEQGRGFAVVASEVRSLAQRSAQAAKEIKDLIADSVLKVDQGTHQVEQAGDTIQALVIDVQQVSGLMRSIAEASAEQSRGVQQVNKTVTEMDKVVQQNASAVQQSASAAEGMRQHAQALLKAVGTFRLSREAAPPGGARPAAGGPLAIAPARPPATRGEPGDEWEQF